MTNSDRLFCKRKARKIDSHKRALAKRDPYDMILIVCEGEKTEVNYFNALIKDLKLNTANVKVTDSTDGSSPRSVVNCALKIFKKEKELGVEYNRIYCVIDRDRHQDYDEAIDIVNRSVIGKYCSIQAIVSTPCFEFWILLHYIFSEKYYYTSQGSVCNKVIIDLKREIEEYEKGSVSIFGKLKDKTKKAIDHARRIDQSNIGDQNKYRSNTTIYKLISDLEDLKAQNKREISGTV